MVIVPPGGFAGFSQMTPASKAALSTGGSRSRGRRTKRKTSKKKRATKRASGKKRGKMKFGSPAWQKKYKVGKYRK